MKKKVLAGIVSGIVLSLAGGPFFIWLLLRQRGGRIHD